jgi:hypothetical protein
MGWVGRMTRMEDMKNARNILVGQLEGKEAIADIYTE